MSIALIDNTFPEQLTLIRTLNTCGMGISLIIQMSIGLSTYRKIRKSKIRRELKYLFIICFVLAILYTLRGLVVNILKLLSYEDHPVVEVAYVSSVFMTSSFLLALLSTLIARLMLTFNGSELAVSNRFIFIFAFILMLSFISSIVFGVGFILIFVGNDIGNMLYFPFLFLFLFLYIFGSALSVRLFVVKLSEVSKNQIGTLHAVIANPEDVSLNPKQEKVLHLSAKYILLFFVAITSTILMVLLVVFLSLECAGFLVSADLCVNLWCLHLQFAFAEREYRKCCGFMDSWCSAVVFKRAKKVMHRESMSVQAELARIQSLSVPESPSTGSVPEFTSGDKE